MSLLAQLLPQSGFNYWKNCRDGGLELFGIEQRAEGHGFAGGSGKPWLESNPIPTIIPQYHTEDRSQPMAASLTRDLILGFMKLHILHHASEEPVFGMWLIEELGRHGYRLSPGTLYPILHALEREGYLKPEARVIGGKVRKYYAATHKGTRALAEARAKARELFDEIL